MLYVVEKFPHFCLGNSCNLCLICRNNNNGNGKNNEEGEMCNVLIPIIFMQQRDVEVYWDQENEH